MTDQQLEDILKRIESENEEASGPLAEFFHTVPNSDLGNAMSYCAQCSISKDIEYEDALRPALAIAVQRTAEAIGDSANYEKLGEELELDYGSQSNVTADQVVNDALDYIYANDLFITLAKLIKAADG